MSRSEEVSVLAQRIIEGDYEFLVEFLQNDGDPNVRFNGYSLLGLAAKHGNEVAAQYLIDDDCLLNSRSGSKNSTPLLLAVKQKHSEVAEILLRDDRCDVLAADSSGITALMAASRNNMVATMRRLLKRGARTEVEAQGTGHTALTLAVAKGNTDAVELLLDYGANTEHKTKEGKTATDLAWDLSESGSGSSKRAIVELLVKYEGKRKEYRDAIGDESELIKGRYRVMKIIGSGTFGSVLLVRDEKSDLEGMVKAIKTIPMPDSMESWTDIEDGKHEAALMKQLDHPGIVGIYDYFNLSKKYCIVIEHCDFGDLSSWISGLRNADLRFPFNTVMHWFLQLLLAIDYLHSNKIMHRDLKPKNIFLRSDAVVKIGDFGLSRRMLNSTDYASTFAGTIKYLSPEVLKGEPYDYKSDIWAIGCTLYELCACSSLYKGDQAQMKEKIINEKVQQLPRSCPDELNDIFINFLMTKRRKDRATAEEVLKTDYIRRNLKDMKKHGLEADEKFLRQNRQHVFGDEDVGFSDSDTFSSTSGNSHSSTLMSVVSAELTNKKSKPIAWNDLHLNKASRNIFDEVMPTLKRREEAGFPLAEVTALIRRMINESPKEKRKALRRLTEDLETCELVELLVVAELSISSNDSY